MVAFVRVVRDKRGYEQIFLMRASGQRGKGGSPRALYVFRTPPGVKVGREPFDDSVRRMLEEQNPGVQFDWKKLSIILPPPPDVEYWRERRRAEKAAKLARRAEEHEGPGAREAASAAPTREVELEEAGEETDVEIEAGSEEPAETPAQASLSSADTPRPGGPRRRRRRRGGRGRKRHTHPEGLAQAPADSPNVTDDPPKER